MPFKQNLRKKTDGIIGSLKFKRYMLSQKEMLEQFGETVKTSPTARKFQKIWARPAIEGEIVVTETADGVETQNTAQDGDMVVWNLTSAGEQYIIRAAKFPKLYYGLPLTTTEDGWEWTQYAPKGIVKALKVTDENCPNEFEAPWGETMVCKVGDYLVCPLKDNQIYRIAEKEFHETYEFGELTQDEMLRFYADDILASPTASKFLAVWMRPAVEGETIVTTTADGIETTKTAVAGDVVVKNTTGAGEEYIINRQKFEKRYVKLSPTNTQGAWVMYMPVGQVNALEVTTDNNPNDFFAPWGEIMSCKVGDFLAMPIGTSPEIYRIARKEFFETYKFDAQ